MATDIVIRTGLDRLRYALLFEGTLIIILSVLAATFFDRTWLAMGLFSVTLSLIALVVNVFYNYAFDRFDVRYGRIPTERTHGWRLVHAAGFEFSLVLVNMPVIMWWMNWQWWQALALDIAIAFLAVIYTYSFTLAYDRVFPIEQRNAAT